TIAKAKAVKPIAEKMITLGRRGDLAARRQALAYLRSNDIVTQLFSDVAPRFTDMPGGYSRIVKLGPRYGDSAEMVYLELVDYAGGPPVAHAPKALNTALPDDVSVIGADEVAPDFHARHSARARSYRYRIWRRETPSPFEQRHSYWYPGPLGYDALADSADLL